VEVSVVLVEEEVVEEEEDQVFSTKARRTKKAFVELSENGGPMSSTKLGLA
jgi:hypothetical protein